MNHASSGSLHSRHRVRETISQERSDLLDMIFAEGQLLAQGHGQKGMTNTSWWSTYNVLASHVLLGRRKGCSGSNLLSYFFWWLSLLSQPCLSPRRRVDGTVSPGQGEAAAILRRGLLMERMGTYMVTEMGTESTGIQVNLITRKCGSRLQNPRTKHPNQNQAINRR